jgi:hypothetical protein
VLQLFSLYGDLCTEAACALTQSHLKQSTSWLMFSAFPNVWCSVHTPLYCHVAGTPEVTPTAIRHSTRGWEHCMHAHSLELDLTVAPQQSLALPHQISGLVCVC